jgi:hypothetical protein
MKDPVLVVPPRSQQLKLELSYDEWSLLRNGLIALRLLAMKRGHELETTAALNLDKKVQSIQAALLKEGHV